MRNMFESKQLVYRASPPEGETDPLRLQLDSGVVETLCGTFSPGLVSFIALCAMTHFDDAVHHSHFGYSWTAPSFTAHHALRISTAIHKALAVEMMRAMDNVRARRPYSFGPRARHHRSRPYDLKRNRRRPPPASLGTSVALTHLRVVPASPAAAPSEYVRGRPATVR